MVMIYEVNLKLRFLPVARETAGNPSVRKIKHSVGRYKGGKRSPFTDDIHKKTHKTKSYKTKQR